MRQATLKGGDPSGGLGRDYIVHCGGPVKKKQRSPNHPVLAAAKLQKGMSSASDAEAVSSPAPGLRSNKTALCSEIKHVRSNLKSSYNRRNACAPQPVTSQSIFPFGHAPY